MSGILTSRWGMRVFSAVLFSVLTLAVSGVLQAITGAGTPCNSCASQCFTYHAGRTPAQGGCKQPSGFPDYDCIAQKCANWCDGCIDTSQNMIDCENPNCWQDGIEIEGGTLCANGCYGMLCEVGQSGSPDKHCYQKQQPCGPEDSSFGCSRCSCVE